MNPKRASAVVLGCMMYRPKDFITRDVREILFPTSAERAIHTTIMALGPNATPDRVIDALEQEGKLNDVGGSDAIMAIAAHHDTLEFDQAVNALWGQHMVSTATKTTAKLSTNESGPDVDAVIRDSFDTFKRAILLRPGGLDPDDTTRLRELEDSLAPAQETHRYGDDFEFALRDHLVTIRVTQVQETRDGLSAELTIQSGIAGLLHFGRIVLGSTSARETLVRKLEKRKRGGDPPWAKLIENVCFDVSAAIREGDPIDDTPMNLDTPEVPITWDIGGLMPTGKIAMLFGDSESLKSTLTFGILTYAALGKPFPNGFSATRPLRSLFLDWEDDRPVRNYRVRRILKGLGETTEPSGLLYHKMTRPIDEAVPFIKAEIARLRADVVVIDSAGMAYPNEPPESPTTAIRVMTSARRLGVSALVIHHISKADQREGRLRAFGSQYYRNETRAAWGLLRSEEQPDEDAVVIGAFPTKTSYGKKPRPCAFRINFSNNLIRFHAQDVEEQADLKSRLSLTTQIITTLKRGAMTVKDLAEEIGKPENTVRTYLNRMAKRGLVIRIDPEDGNGKKDPRWGLKSR